MKGTSYKQALDSESTESNILGSFKNNQCC